MFNIKPEKLINDNNINLKTLKKFIEAFNNKEVPKLTKLYGRYNRETTDNIVVNLEKYISDVIVNYTFGKPIQYNNVSEEFLNNMTVIDEDSHNINLAKDQSIFGRAYEYIYLTEEGTIDLVNLNPLNTFVVYSNDIVPKPILAVYITAEEDEDGEIKGYTVLCWSEVYTYKYYGKELEQLKLIEAVNHYFGRVPVIELKNNREEKADFSDVVGLIEKYEELQSNRITDKQQFVDRLLVITNSSLGDTEEEFERSKEILKNGGILELNSDDGNVGAQFISQSFNEAEVETLKKSIEADIFRLSKIPNLADENFGNTSSGISLKYKLFGTEMIAIEKERNFKKLLRERIIIINNIYNLKNSGMELGDIDIIFTRNIPSSPAERLQELQGTEGILSLETRIMRYDPEIDVVEEIRKIEEEKANDANLVNRSFSNYVVNQPEEEEEINPKEE